MASGKLKIVKIEEFIKWYSNFIKLELNKRDSKNKRIQIEVLKPANILERYNKDHVFKDLIDKKQFNKISLILQTRSKNAKLMNENLSKEDRLNNAKKGHETLGPAGRSARTNKANETLGSDGRKARTAKGKETLGPEGRSKISFDRAITLGEDGLSKIARKTVATTKEIHGEYFYSILGKENNKKTQISVKKRTDKNYKKILSNLPLFFTSSELRDAVNIKFNKIKVKPGTGNILKSSLVDRNILIHKQHRIHKNKYKPNKINTLDSVINKINEEIKIKPNQLFLKKLNKWLDTMPDSGITQDMMNKFMRADRVRPHLILEKEVLGRTGKPIWKKCTWKK